MFLTRQQRFSLPLFESVFAEACGMSSSERKSWTLDAAKIQALATSEEFLKYSQDQTTNTAMVKGRLRTAREALCSQ